MGRQLLYLRPAEVKIFPLLCGVIKAPAQELLRTEFDWMESSTIITVQNSTIPIPYPSR